MPKTKHSSLIDYGISSVSIPGQSESGDLYFVKETKNNVLIGVIDGLGHGAEAATAAKLAVKVLDAYSEVSIIAAARLCHDSLRSTRGVVMALVSISPDDETITWLSIGNVEGILLRADPHSNPVYENIIMRPGVIGYRLPPLYASVVSISKGDLLILTTDGIKDDYIPKITADLKYNHEQLTRSGERNINELIGDPMQSTKENSHSSLQLPSNEPTLFRGRWMDLTPHFISNYICNRFNKGSDDALVLAAKYNGKR